MSNRILIAGGTIVSFDDTVGQLATGDVLIEDGRIREIAPHLDVIDSLRIDAANQIVLPGLIDSHSHLWEQVLRNVGVDWSLHDYHRGVRGIFGGLFRPEDSYASTLLGATEALLSGVTSIFDCSHNMNTPDHADAVVEALRDAGIRATLAYGSANADWTPSNHLNAETPQTPLSRDAVRVHDQYFSGRGGLLRMALSSRGSRGNGGLEALSTDVAMARELGIPITFSFGRRPRPQGGLSDVQLIHEAGLTGDDLLYYHCDQLYDEDIAIIRDTGGSIAYTPEGELRAAYAVAPIGKLLRAGIRPGIGVDTPAIASDYFNAMRATLAAEGALQRIDAMGTGGDVERVNVTVRDVLGFATADGAHTSHLDDVTGSLTPGKAADVTLIDKAALSITPVYDPIGAVVYNGYPAAVSTVLVAGRIVKLAGEYVGADLARVARLADESRAYLFDKAGIDPFATGI